MVTAIFMNANDQFFYYLFLRNSEYLVGMADVHPVDLNTAVRDTNDVLSLAGNSIFLELVLG